MRCSRATRIFAACRRMELLSRRLGRLPKVAQGMFSHSAALFGGRGSQPQTGGVGFGLHASAELRSSVLSGAGAVSFGGARSILSSPDCRDATQSLDRMLQESVTASQSLDPVNRVSYLESQFYMRNTLLRDSDFMSMAHGLELRVPFLDKMLVEACFRIPGSKKLQGNSPKACCWRALASSCQGRS